MRMYEFVGTVIESKSEADYLGERTPFRSLANKLIKSVVNQGKWFCFIKGIADDCIDILSIENKNKVKLGNMIPESLFESNIYGVRIKKYLLLDYMCYCEVPMFRKEKGQQSTKASFNKMILTCNMSVVAEWLGITVEEAEKTYGSYRTLVDDGENYFPYLKLTNVKGVHKVTRPRTPIDLGQSGLRIVPMFALRIGVNSLYTILCNNICNVRFVKDSGQVRDMCTTFDKEAVHNLYKGYDDFINMNLDKVYDGSFDANPSLDRGYIRVFELGSSVYGNPLRSINFARIIGFEVAEPDMSFMLIDLDSTLDVFTNCLYSRSWTDEDISVFVESLEDFEVGSTRDFNGAKITSVIQLENWAEQQNILLSTIFVRQLALCMIANPELFNGYTGSPEVFSSSSVEASSDSQSFTGLAPEELDFGF